VVANEVDRAAGAIWALFVEAHEEPTPEALKNRAAELGITPEELIKKFIEKALTIDAREANSG